jgi:sorbitol-specific phosphotransferase system component IIC
MASKKLIKSIKDKIAKMIKGEELIDALPDEVLVGLDELMGTKEIESFWHRKKGWNFNLYLMIPIYGLLTLRDPSNLTYKELIDSVAKFKNEQAGKVLHKITEEDEH